MDTNLQGKITEIEVLRNVINSGYSVSIPFGDKDRYDQIWDIDGKLLRIQVKTCHQRTNKSGELTNAIEFNCYSTSNGKRHIYNKKDIDFFATYWNGKVYLVPVEECSIEKTLWFELKKGVKSLAKDYEFNEMMKKL
jgi:hypothetical protein